MPVNAGPLAFRFGLEQALLSARGRVLNLPLLPFKPVMPLRTLTPSSYKIQKNP